MNSKAVRSRDVLRTLVELREIAMIMGGEVVMQGVSSIELMVARSEALLDSRVSAIIVADGGIGAWIALSRAGTDESGTLVRIVEIGGQIAPTRAIVLLDRGILSIGILLVAQTLVLDRARVMHTLVLHHVDKH